MKTAMFDWLFRNRKDELPSYSLLNKVPSRPLPQPLKSQEESEEFTRSRDKIESELFDVATDHDAPAFAIFLKDGCAAAQSDAAERRLALVQMPLPTGDCLVVFSTPIRAADYARAQLPGQKLEYLCSTPRQAHQLLILFREQGNIHHIAIDRCPRCSTFAILKTASIESIEKLVRMFKIWKATEIARCNLYREYARTAANDGKLLAGRDVALELVGHVTPEDPQTHLLLGKLAIRLRDKTLLREAYSWLAILNKFGNEGDMSNQLRVAETTTDWQF